MNDLTDPLLVFATMDWLWWAAREFSKIWDRRTAVAALDSQIVFWLLKRGDP